VTYGGRHGAVVLLDTGEVVLKYGDPEKTICLTANGSAVASEDEQDWVNALLKR